MNKGTERQRFVGIYSYPKSGNTWLRSILTSALGGTKDEAHALHKYVPDSVYGGVFDHPLVKDRVNWYFYKSHSCTPIEHLEGRDFVNNKLVYIYRHPLDVFVSYLNFLSNNVTGNGCPELNLKYNSVEELSATDLNNLFLLWLDKSTLNPGNSFHGNIYESIFNFLDLAKAQDNVFVTRYEDLFEDFNKTVENLFEFLDFSGFDVEKVYSSAENFTSKDGQFFWKKKMGNYADFLTEQQISLYEETHADKLQRLGYL